MILKPLLRTLRGMDDKDRLLRIQELDICIEGNTGRKHILTNLMATGVLEPTVFNKENAALVMEEQKLRAEKGKLRKPSERQVSMSTASSKSRIVL